MINKIETLLNQKGISKGKMLSDLGLNKNLFAQWSGGSAPKTTTILKIAEYFNVSVDYLLGTGQKEKVDYESGTHRRLVEIYHKLPKDKQELLEQMAIAMLNQNKDTKK